MNGNNIQDLASNLPVVDSEFEDRLRAILRQEIEAAYDRIKAGVLLNGWPRVKYTYNNPKCSTCGGSGRIWVNHPETSDAVMWKTCPDCNTSLEFDKQNICTGEGVGFRLSPTIVSDDS